MKTRSRLERVFRNVSWGASRGVVIAGMYCLWVSFLYVLRGTEPFERLGVTFGSVVATYLAIGASAGAIVGLLRPLAARGVGAYLVGLAAGFPVALGIVITSEGLPKSWDYVVWLCFPIFWLAAGMIMGRAMRRGSTNVMPQADKHVNSGTT
jgi:hypothetical protein